MSGFTGLTALVTGGTSGIGLAVARELARQGARVVVCGRRQDAGRDAVQGLGERARFVACDVTREEEVEAAVRAAASGGRLDIAVNCAGMSPRRSKLVDAGLDAYHAVFGANVQGTFLALKHELRVMEDGGSIVNVASVLGIKAVDLGHALYTAAKHAVVGLSKAAALEAAARNVRVNVVCPGVIDTPIHATNVSSDEERRRMAALHPLNRLGTPEEAASAIVYLCSPKASFITGSVFTVDGGASL